MKVVSFNVGPAIAVNWKGETVITGIYKRPVEGKHKIAFATIEGDEQADLTVHGGADKAVYAYDTSHYRYWKNILQRADWNYGLFGENLTTEGLYDEQVKVGNIYQIGSTKLMALQPRFPCFKLNIRFNLSTMAKLFAQQKRNGIYFRVIEEGYIQVNDTIQLAQESQHTVTIQDFVESYYTRGSDKALLARILAIEFLPSRMRQQFEVFAE